MNWPLITIGLFFWLLINLVNKGTKFDKELARRRDIKSHFKQLREMKVDINDYHLYDDLLPRRPK